MVLHGAYLPLFGASRIPVLILMSFFMHLSLATEYFLTDCVVLLFVGKDSVTPHVAVSL